MIISQDILNHYLQFGIFTYPGLFQSKLKNELPDSIEEISKLVRSQIIHRIELVFDKKLAASLAWHRQPDEANLQTASAILAELHRRDSAVFPKNRKVEDKLILTCRPISILMAAILKSKSIPARVRSGFVSYFNHYGGKRADHWINQYWNKKEGRWITIDVDGSSVIKEFNPFDIPVNRFNFSADAWLKIRNKKLRADHFWNPKPETGLAVVARELMYDFHSLMNAEIPYFHYPKIVVTEEFNKLAENDLKEIDSLAKIMKNPDKNFSELRNVWNSNKKFRLLKGPLLYN